MKITKEKDGTKIESCLIASCVDMVCFIGKNGTDNSDAKFYLGMKSGGQVDMGCDLTMRGPLERADFLQFLKQIVIEMDI